MGWGPWVISICGTLLVKAGRGLLNDRLATGLVRYLRRDLEALGGSIDGGGHLEDTGDCPSPLKQGGWRSLPPSQRATSMAGALED